MGGDWRSAGLAPCPLQEPFALPWLDTPELGGSAMQRFLITVLPVFMALGIISIFNLKAGDARAVWVAVALLMIRPMRRAMRRR